MKEPLLRAEPVRGGAPRVVARGARAQLPHQLHGCGAAAEPRSGLPLLRRLRPGGRLPPGVLPCERWQHSPLALLPWWLCGRPHPEDAPLRRGQEHGRALWARLMATMLVHTGLLS